MTSNSGPVGFRLVPSTNLHQGWGHQSKDNCDLCVYTCRPLFAFKLQELQHLRNLCSSVEWFSAKHTASLEQTLLSLSSLCSLPSHLVMHWHLSTSSELGPSCLLHVCHGGEQHPIPPKDSLPITPERAVHEATLAVCLGHCCAALIHKLRPAWRQYRELANDTVACVQGRTQFNFRARSS